MMDMFNPCILSAREIISGHTIIPVDTNGELWPIVDKTPFIMERDTKIELGGHPKESVSLILSSSDVDLSDMPELSFIGDPLLMNRESHISYGKVVLLKTDDFSEDAIYDYLQSAQMADVKMRFKDVMLRTSSQQFYTNMRISKTAACSGFDAYKMGRTMLRQFKNVPHVTEAKIVLIFGDSPIYKKLISVAENAKLVNVAIYNRFEGMDMECESCAIKPICDQVEGIKKMHESKLKNR